MLALAYNPPGQAFRQHDAGAVKPERIVILAKASIQSSLARLKGGLKIVDTLPGLQLPGQALRGYDVDTLRHSGKSEGRIRNPVKSIDRPSGGNSYWNPAYVGMMSN